MNQSDKGYWVESVKKNRFKLVLMSIENGGEKSKNTFTKIFCRLEFGMKHCHEKRLEFDSIKMHRVF